MIAIVRIRNFREAHLLRRQAVLQSKIPGPKRKIPRALSLVLLFSLVSAGPVLAEHSHSDRGPIVLATSKDLGGKLHFLLSRWNTAHPGEEVTIFDLLASADEQRAAVTHMLQTQDDHVDLINADIVWIAEFAARGWLEPLEGDRFASDKILQGPADTARFNGQLFGAPYTTDVGMLYYRTDLLEGSPTTWAELQYLCDTVAAVNAIQCYAGQFAAYEGLTVNLFELIGARGTSPGLGTVDLGTVVRSSGAQRAVGMLVDGLRNGWIPKVAESFKEEDGRQMFQSGNLLFLRNWSYVYPLANGLDTTSKVAGKFDVAPLPGPDGIVPSVLGGSDLILSRFSRHQATAMDWMAFMQSEETQRAVLTVLFQMPVLSTVYDDPDLQRQIPYLQKVKHLIENATARPKLSYYNSFTVSLTKEVSAALAGEKSITAALADLSAELKQAARK